MELTNIIDIIKQTNITNIDELLIYFKKNNKYVIEEELLALGIKYIIDQKLQT